MACCIFKGCFNKPIPFGKVIFFNLPKDEPRRGRWLALSGNEEVQNLPASAKRLVCENHFEERYLRRQFHRTTLNRDAVPVDYRLRKGDSSANGTEDLKEKKDEIKEEEATATDQEEILLISADEESDYEVIVEEMLCEESGPTPEANEDLVTPILVDGEEASEEHVVTEGHQTGNGYDLPQESEEGVETYVIADEESCEEEIKTADHKPNDSVDETNILDSSLDGITDRVSKSEEGLQHENKTDEQAQESGEALVIENVETNEAHEVSNSNQQNIVVNPAKHKLPTKVATYRSAKKLKKDEVVEPDTSSVSVTPVAAVTNPLAIEQPSTSSVPVPVPVEPTPPGKMSEEEYFALSLVGPLQRLPPEKRAIAKMKILTYLVQLECGLPGANL